MSFYEQLRHFADGHFLLIMFGIFLVLCLWPFRPGSKQRNQAARDSIFKDHDDA